MGQYQDISIKDLVEGINEKYFLPDIQREFVWKSDRAKFEDKVYDLFDSIMRGYPIGTLLFWDVTYENLIEDNLSVLKFLENSDKDNEQVKKENLKGKEISLVLDGQQRMTILNLAFKGIFEEMRYKKRKKRYLYFNLLSNNKEEREINERFYEFKLIESEEPYFKEGGEKVWHRVDLLLVQPKSITEYWEKINNKADIEKEDRNRILDNLTNFWKIITEKNISYFKIPKGRSDEEALEIFVRVNSGGVTLTYSDLLFSKIKQYWKKGKEKIDAREDFKNFLNEINNNKFEFNNDFILKTSLVLIEKDVRYRVKNFDKENVGLIKENWQKIKDSIRIVIQFLGLIGITDKKSLRSNNALIPMIYYVYKKELREIDNTSRDFEILKKYIYTVLINGVFGGQADSLLADSRKIIKESKEELFPIARLFNGFIRRNKVIRKGDELFEFLKDIKYNTDKSRLILNIIYGNNLPLDFQEDHMFPQSDLLKKHDKKIVDNIANLQPLGAFTNNLKNNKKFKEWLEEPNRSEEYRELNLIPKMKDYNEKNFEIFVKKRRELIFEKVKEFFE